MFRNFAKDLSLSAIIAGLLAVSISYAGPLVIFLHAADVGNINSDMVSSWIWAVSIGAAIPSIILSIYYKIPVIIAWSLPGTALLVSVIPDMSMAEIVGAYLSSAILVFIIGFSGYFDKLMKLIPSGVAAGMMAGILFQFGTDVFKSIPSIPYIAISMILTYLFIKKFYPRRVIIAVALIGFIASYFSGVTNFSSITLKFTVPIFIWPEFNLATFLSFTIPLTLVSLTGQFMPGMAVFKVANYNIGAKQIMSLSGIISLFCAFFGGITNTLSAITATLCTGKECHENPDKRYIAGVSNGFFYIIGGFFAGSLVLIFSSIPKEVIAVLAGLALIAAILGSLTIVMNDTQNKEASFITFLSTASGVTFLGLGSAFWGVIIGIISVYILKQYKKT